MKLTLTAKIMLSLVILALAGAVAYRLQPEFWERIAPKAQPMRATRATKAIIDRYFMPRIIF